MRRRILDAAKALFVKEGFDNVSLRRIAGAIDYSPAALYRYFKNKREILSVLRNEGFDRYLERQRERVMQYPDPLDRLTAGGKGYIRFAMEEPEYFHLMFGTGCKEVDMEGKWAESSLESFENFRGNVRECVEAGHFGDVDADMVVFAMWSSVHGLAHLFSSGQVPIVSELELSSFVDDIIEFFLRSEKKKST